MLGLGRHAVRKPNAWAAAAPLWELLSWQHSAPPILSASYSAETAAGASRALASATPPPPLAAEAVAAAPSQRQAAAADLQQQQQEHEQLESLADEMRSVLRQRNYQQVLRLLPTAMPKSVRATHGARLAAAQVFDAALTACAALGDGDSAEALVRRMWKLWVPVGTHAHGAVLRALCAQGSVARALAYLRSITLKRLRPDMFITVLMACRAAGDAEAVRRCVDLLQRRLAAGAIAPSPPLLSELLQAVGVTGDAAALAAAWEVAAPAAAAAEAAGDASTSAMLEASRISGLARLWQLDEALAAAEALMDRHALLLPVALDTRSSGGSADGQSGSEGVGGHADLRLDPVHYMRQACNAVLRGAEKAGDQGTVQRLTSQMMLRGLTPDVTTYNILLRAALARGDGLPAVEEGFQEMQRLGLTPNLHTYLVLIAAHGEAGDAAGARAAFEAAAAASPGGRAPPQALRALLVALGAACDLQGLADLAAEQLGKGRGLHADQKTYAALFNSIVAWGMHESTLRPLSEEPFATVKNTRRFQRQLAAALLRRWTASMADVQLAHTPDTLGALLAALGHTGQVEEVRQLMALFFGESSADTSSSSGAGQAQGAGEPQAAGSEQAEQQQQQRINPELPKQQPQLEPTLQLFNEAIAACTRSGGMHPALELLKRMQELGVAPDAATYTCLIAGCAFRRQAGLAHSLLNSMRRKGLAPSVQTYNALLKVECFCGSMEGALQLVGEMAQRGLHPDRVTWATLLSSGRRLGRDDIVALAQQQLSPEAAGAAAATAAASEGSEEGQGTQPSAAAVLAVLAELEKEAAKAAQAAEEGEEGGKGTAGDHRWHGPYDLGEDEDW